MEELVVSGNVEPVTSKIWNPFFKSLEANFVSQKREDLSARSPVAGIVVALSECLDECRVSVIFSVQR